MNEQLKYKRFRGELNGSARSDLQTVTRAKRAAVPRECGAPNRPIAPGNRRLHPARELMICLGWLRLFQAIVADGIPLTEHSRKL
jgi:phosphatidylserine decarboxylase